MGTFNIFAQSKANICASDEILKMNYMTLC